MRGTGFGFVLAVAACVTVAGAQSVNVDFGAGSTPGAAYGAQGLAGAWNTIGVLPPAQRAPLVGVDGLPSGIEIYMIGGTALFAADDPTTSGDDAALLDDMLIGYNDPVDVCVWFANVPAGEYEVILYGITPSDPSLLHRLRVDYALPGATMCGGAWAGFHQEGVSFVRFRVYTESGYIGLHSGLYGGYLTSGLNGVQVRADPPTSTEPPATESVRSRVLRAFPNPSAGSTSIEFALGGAAPAGSVLQVVDVAGRVVWRQDLAGLGAGTHAVAWDGRSARRGRAPAGVYFARLGTARRSVAHETAPVRIVRLPAIGTLPDRPPR